MPLRRGPNHGMLLKGLVTPRKHELARYIVGSAGIVEQGLAPLLQCHGGGVEPPVGLHQRGPLARQEEAWNYLVAGFMRASHGVRVEVWPGCRVVGDCVVRRHEQPSLVPAWPNVGELMALHYIHQGEVVAVLHPSGEGRLRNGHMHFFDPNFIFRTVPLTLLIEVSVEGGVDGD